MVQDFIKEFDNIIEISMSTANQKGGSEVHVTSLDLFKNTVTTIADSKKDNRDFIDLLNIYSSFVIYDSILKPFQTGEIIINDSNDLIPNYPILGKAILFTLDTIHQMVLKILK